MILVKVFCDEYTKHMNELRAAQTSTLKSHQTEQDKLGKERDNVLQAIREGISASLVKDELEQISARLEKLEALIEHERKEARPFLHPTMAARYRKEVLDLRESLNREDSRAEAAEHLRQIIDKVVLTPKPDQAGLQIDLHGDLAGILNMAAREKTRENKEIKDIQKLKRLPVVTGKR